MTSSANGDGGQGHDEPAPIPPVPGRTYDEKLRNVWGLAWRTNNGLLSLHETFGENLRETVRTKGLLVKLAEHMGFDLAIRQSEVDAIREAEALVGTATLPPMRSEAPSTASLLELQERAVLAARQGEHQKELSAEEEVKRVFAEEWKRREEKAKADADARELAARREDEEKAKRERAETREKRKKFWVGIAMKAALAGAGAGGIKFVEWVGHLFGH